MDHTAYIVAALANVPTIITVLIGILLNNGRLNDTNSRIAAIEGRMNAFDQKLNNIDTKLDTRFDILIGKIDEIDNRLTRLESQRH